MDSKISDLTLVSSVTGDDVLPIVNGGSTKKVKVSQLNIPSIVGLATTTYVDSQDALKVDKVAGKVLSDENYTSVEKTKLAGVQNGAEVNVNADWNSVSGDSQILNKPTIPSAQVNSDWNSTTGVSQILNKPTITNLVPYTGANNPVNLGSYNLTANNIFGGYTSISASATLITLTLNSVPSYLVIGSGGQTFKMPNANTIPNGAIYYFNNNQSSGVILLNNNSNVLIKSIPNNSCIYLQLINNSTADGIWEAHFQTPTNVNWSNNVLDYLGSITGATWNGVAIADSKIASASSWNAKANIDSPTFIGAVVLPSTTSIGNVSTAEISYLDNVTSPIQTQLNALKLELIYLDSDDTYFDAFYIRTVTDGATFEASNYLLSTMANLRSISYVSQGFIQQINADKFVQLGGTAEKYLMANGSALSNIATNTTTTALSLATLNSTYPTAIIGFRVHCISITAGKLIYERTSTGWVSYSITTVI